MDKRTITGKKAKSRMKIMHAAKYLCEKNGIENVTFHDIAKEADVCRTTVFNHFSTTDQLMIALFCQEIEDIDQYCSEINCSGMAMIEAVFDKLIEDTAYYPVLTYKIASSTILRGGVEDNSLIYIEKMIADGADTFVEIGPGKTLCGFMRKIDRSVKAINIAKVEDLEKLKEIM